jgi:4-amino-4-deoxy-L-arabinose transferase-like glycosyltransferase
VSTPTPALVTQRAVQRLPRWALLLFCAAYVLPGALGREPWKSADITAFGYMVAIGEGRTSWLAPTVGGLPLESGLLPHWLGAAFVSVLSPTVDAAVAARLPFLVLLALTLVLVWYSSYHLARTEAAQPVALAFGGEAHAVDYARAVADGALLALVASLGLLQLGHETTPELVQLFAVSLYLWSLSAAPFRQERARAAVLLALPLLAASGAPMIAVAIGVVGSVACMPTNRHVPSCRGRQPPRWHRCSRPTGWAPGRCACISSSAARSCCSSQSCCCGSCGRPGRSRCGRSGAGGATC